MGKIGGGGGAQDKDYGIYMWAQIPRLSALPTEPENAVVNFINHHKADYLNLID
jgi:hypothetical protein